MQLFISPRLTSVISFTSSAFGGGGLSALREVVPAMHVQTTHRAYLLIIGCFLSLMVGGRIPVAPGNYTQQWPLQAEINLTLSSAVSIACVRTYYNLLYSFHTVPLGSKSTRTRSRSCHFRKLSHRLPDPPNSSQACLGQKSGLFLKNRLYFCVWSSCGFCVAW